MRSWLTVLVVFFSLNSVSHAVELRGRLTDKKGKEVDFSEFVLWVENGSSFSKNSNPQPSPVNMDMVKTKFSPRTIAIHKGEKVRFENLDKIFHNVFSLDDANTFDLGLYKGPVAFTDDKKRKAKAKSPVQSFPNSGKVNVYCNIHSDMHGIVHVFDHPFFTMAKAEGGFSLDIPDKPGTYKIHIDSRKLDEPVVKEIVVTGNDISPVEWPLKLLKWSKSTNHTKKDGSAYRERSY